MPTGSRSSRSRCRTAFLVEPVRAAPGLDRHALEDGCHFPPARRLRLGGRPRAAVRGGWRGADRLEVGGDGRVTHAEGGRDLAQRLCPVSRSATTRRRRAYCSARRSAGSRLGVHASAGLSGSLRLNRPGCWPRFSLLYAEGIASLCGARAGCRALYAWPVHSGRSLGGNTAVFRPTLIRFCFFDRRENSIPASSSYSIGTAKVHAGVRPVRAGLNGTDPPTFNVWSPWGQRRALLLAAAPLLPRQDRSPAAFALFASIAHGRLIRLHEFPISY